MRSNNALRSAILKTAVITPSGALSPGPLSASAVAVGASLGVYGGVLVALGHLVVELPYFILLLIITRKMEEKLGNKILVLNIFSIAFIIYFAYLLADLGINLVKGSSLMLDTTTPLSALDAFIAGVVLTGANAYFLAWWVSVGKPIIDEAKKLNLPQKAIVYIVHYSYDLAWLALLAYLGGIAALGGEYFLGWLMIALSAVLLYFAVSTIIDTTRRVVTRQR